MATIVTGKSGEISQGAVGTVRTLHLVFKTHLDVGFTELAKTVTDGYFSRYIPQAIDLARRLREAGGPERFIWTTGSWLIYEYLKQAGAAARRRMEEAIAAGDIAWHGLPFTTHSELIDPSLFRAGLQLAQELDRRYGRHTIAAKMTDVPGHTRGIVPLLAEAGIQFLHIGVNAACTAPDVPPAFAWRAPTGEEVVVSYQRSYGDLLKVPGLPDALLFAHTNDNMGPQSALEVADVFARAREQFPGAMVIASTMDRFAEALWAVRAQLPVLTQEIGDTWIHGVGCDPTKVARYRELCRLRRGWLAAAAGGDAAPNGSGADLGRCSRDLLLVAEHTWGLDAKTHLGNWKYQRVQKPLDNSEFTGPAFQAARQRPAFQKMEASWAEQRGYVDEAVAALDDSGWGRQAQARLAAIAPRRPDMGQLRPVTDAGQCFENEHLALRFDPEHGSLTYLRDKRSGRVWADGAPGLALFRYQTFSADDYLRYWQRYCVRKREWQIQSWARTDLTKPGLEATGAGHRWWLPRLERLFAGEDDGGIHLLAELSLDEESWTTYGAPRSATLEVTLPRQKPALDLTLQWFDKPACRMSEALWLSFVPIGTQSKGWLLDKMGQAVSPLDVVRNGNRHLHAVDSGMSYRDARGGLRLETLDAPLVAPGEPALVEFRNRQPRLSQGMHVNLYNNVWTTNFRLWYEDDARFRFVLAFETPRRDGR